MKLVIILTDEQSIVVQGLQRGQEFWNAFVGTPFIKPRKIQSDELVLAFHKDSKIDRHYPRKPGSTMASKRPFVAYPTNTGENNALRIAVVEKGAQLKVEDQIWTWDGETLTMSGSVIDITEPATSV